MCELELMEIFAGNLRTTMEYAHISQAELARETNLSEATISRYLAGERLPNCKAIINLCHVLCCDLDDLLPTYEIIE